MDINRDDMNFNRDGWVSWQDVAGVDGLHVRIRRTDEGRYVVTDLYLHGDQITAETLRHVSVSRLQAQVNAAMADPVRNPVAAFLSAQLEQPAPDDDTTLDELRSRGAGRTSGFIGEYSEWRPRVTRPDGSDDFYRNLAMAYRQFARGSRAPAKLIAEESGAPVGSVHRWIVEARRRGHLPPGEKGRAG